MNNRPFSLLIFALIFICSCSANHQSITAKTSEIARSQGLEPKIYQTKNFKIFTLQRISDKNKPVRIYLEGDGRAFLNRNLASLNPTPTSYFLINLIKEDPSPNLIYIARPCQYLDDQSCEQKYWTSERFSAKIADAINEVLQNFSTQKLQLIGYSGGGAIAKYLAVKNKNITSLRTIAGNLDQKKFAEIHRVAILDEAFIDNDLPNLATIPQIHFVGSDDKIIPPIIAQTYLEKLPQKDCIKIITIEKATHYQGWDKNWRDLLKIEPSCQ